MSAFYDVGAWQIKEDGFGYPSIYGTDEDGNPGDLVAHTFAGHEHVIAAAPDLLAALERMIAAELADDGVAMAKARHNARAAIARATNGEA